MQLPPAVRSFREPIQGFIQWGGGGVGGVNDVVHPVDVRLTGGVYGEHDC